MSAEKKAQTRAEREEKRRQEERRERRSMAVYSVVAVVVVIAAAALMVWNAGILQRSLTAVEINGTKYSAADMQYYYNSIYSSYANQYFSASVSPKKQIRDQATGQTWYDYLVEQAVESLTDAAALSAQAKSEGYALSAEGQAQRDAAISQLDTAWLSYGQPSRDAFIRARFGPHMTYGRLVELMDMEFLASDYAASRMDAIQHPDSDYESYYQEHKDQLDTIVYTQLAFQAQVPSAEAEVMSDEEKTAALEERKAEQKALAEEVKAKLEGGADLEEIADEYHDRLYSTALSRRSSGSNAGWSNYADWLLDPARRAGDITLEEYDSGSAYYYYVAVFEDRVRDEEDLHSVRHILIRAGDGEGTPTQAEYDEAEEKAQALLDEWKAGEATQDSFAALASANTQDTSSAASGGLYTEIDSWSDYAAPFKDWVLDPARREGDTSLVKTEFGWHVMYYVSSSDPVWRQDTASALASQDYEQIADSAAQGLTVSRGMGMGLISA